MTRPSQANIPPTLRAASRPGAGRAPERRRCFADAARFRRSGLTLVELLLALSVTSMVGAGVAAMMLSVSNGTSERTDMRALLVKQKSVAARFTASVRSSRMVLATGADRLVLWTGDTRADTKPNLSEMRLIERSTDGQFKSYSAAFPPTWSADQIATADTAYELTSDFLAVTATLKAGSYFPGELWAQGVEQFSVTLDSAAQSARLVSYRLTLRSGDGSSALQPRDTAIGAAALRNE